MKKSLPALQSPEKQGRYRYPVPAAAQWRSDERGWDASLPTAEMASAYAKAAPSGYMVAIGTATDIRVGGMADALHAYPDEVHTDMSARLYWSYLPKLRMAECLAPAFGCVAMLSSAGHISEFQKFGAFPEPIIAWVDNSSTGTTNPLAEARYGSDGVLAGTALSNLSERRALMDRRAVERVREDDDQPNYDYGEVIAYAKRMGLPTEFPL